MSAAGLGDNSTGVTDLLEEKDGESEVLRLASALLASLAFALFALGYFCFIGDGNLLPLSGNPHQESAWSTHGTGISVDSCQSEAALAIVPV